MFMFVISDPARLSHIPHIRTRSERVGNFVSHAQLSWRLRYQMRCAHGAWFDMTNNIVITQYAGNGQRPPYNTYKHIFVVQTAAQRKGRRWVAARVHVGSKAEIVQHAITLCSFPCLCVHPPAADNSLSTLLRNACSTRSWPLGFSNRLLACPEANTIRRKSIFVDRTELKDW